MERTSVGYSSFSAVVAYTIVGELSGIGADRATASRLCRPITASLPRHNVQIEPFPAGGAVAKRKPPARHRP
ncbi:MAG: hypothetical protein OXC26_15845 [Albidovulum sp.]|nr:hypothetical protein [Albidovulum sp.]